jgi:hypothetical protein
MPDELCVRVPDDLARELDEEGIEEVEEVRSLDWLGQSAAVAVTLVGTAANVTTVLLAKDSIAKFARSLTGWAACRPHSASADKVVIRLEARGPEDGAHLTFEIEVPAAGGIAEADMARLMSLLAAAFADRRDAVS